MIPFAKQCWYKTFDANYEMKC